jgi:hypothetical protein
MRTRLSYSEPRDLGFDGIPKQRSDVCPTESLDLPDARRGCDVDLGEIRADDVNACENQTATLQKRKDKKPAK